MQDIKNMKKKLLLISILLFSFILLPGCNETSNNIDIDYQIFYSNNITIPDIMNETLSQGEIEEIIEFGKALALQLEYPLNWKSEYNAGGVGIFSIIFYPENTESVHSKSITFDLLFVYPRNITIEELKLKLNIQNPYTDYTEEVFDLNDDVYIWKLISGPQEASQGTAYIVYKPEHEVYQMVITSDDSDSIYIEIFNHMINSFTTDR